MKKTIPYKFTKRTNSHLRKIRRDLDHYFLAASTKVKLLSFAKMTPKDERVLGVKIFSLGALTSASFRSVNLKLMTKRQ